MKVLVPVDYSEHSRAVLNFALEMAPSFSADVTVVHVWETAPEVSDSLTVRLPDGATRRIGELLREEAERTLSEFMKTVRLPLETRLLSGAAAAAITRFAVEGHFDLIVIGTQGRTGIGRLVLGSVAEKVVRTSQVPVLTVPVES